jgi:hypothetical protein
MNRVGDTTGRVNASTALANAVDLNDGVTEAAGTINPAATRESSLEADSRFPRREPSAPKPVFRSPQSLLSQSVRTIDAGAKKVNSLAAFKDFLASVHQLPRELQRACLERSLETLCDGIDLLPVHERQAAADLVVENSRRVPTRGLSENTWALVLNAKLSAVTETVKKGATIGDALKMHGAEVYANQIAYEIAYALAPALIRNGESVEDIVLRLGITNPPTIETLQEYAQNIRRRSAW